VAKLVRQLFGDLDGSVEVLHTDNGGEFCNKDVDGVCDQFNVRHVTGAPYKPSTQGGVESKNKDVKYKVTAAADARLNWLA
jgi:transposase InsO family protein